MMVADNFTYFIDIPSVPELLEESKLLIHESNSSPVIGWRKKDLQHFGIKDVAVKLQLFGLVILMLM